MTGKKRFNTLFLFFINWVGRVISLDCQYIIRVAEESCSNCSRLPKSDDRLLYLYMYSTRDYFRLWLFSDIFVHTGVHSYHKCVHSKILIYHERDLP